VPAEHCLHRRAAGMIYLPLCWKGIPTVLGIIDGVLYLMHSEKRFKQAFVARKKIR
jgi:TM2 domain-containing membrane protein YozV